MSFSCFFLAGLLDVKEQTSTGSPDGSHLWARPAMPQVIPGRDTIGNSSSLNI